MKTLAKIEKSWNFWFLFFLSFIFFLLRLPSLFEPYWYGDEGIYQVLGMAVKNGQMLYRDIFDNKPPLLYLLYSLFNGDQFWLRSMNLAFGIIATIIFFFLTRKLFAKNSASYIATIIFSLLLAIPIFEGNIANAENFMIPIILISALLINKYRHHVSSRLLFFSGLSLGIAFLFKIVAIFDFAAFLLFLIFSQPHFDINSLKKISKIFYVVKSLSLFIVGFLAPILLTAFYFVMAGAFYDFLRATFFNNVNYVSYGNKFIIPQGFLILKLVVLGLFSILILLKKNKLTATGIFIYIWLAFSLFNAFFSQRPYTHYLLTLLPSFGLLIGFLIDNKSWRKLSSILLVVIIYLSLTSFHIYKKNIAYYKNFTSFAFGNKTVSAYEGFFDRRTPIDYEVADFIKNRTKESDNIFIWGNNAQLYKLTDKLPPGKYTVAYHITSYTDGLKNTYRGLVKTKPKFVILMPYMNLFPFSLSGYFPTAKIQDIIIYERTF
ncbi:MAG: glycosyltransferase family 39 protein [Actinobacteria bacterium]|nr:glycosyltransferase family 39 protein [Actinomycetota bacterium]